MKSLFARFYFASVSAALFGLTATAAFAAPAPPDKPLLWRVEGNGLETPSHLFGTKGYTITRILE